MRPRRALTILEILVAVAIILILLTLTLTALWKVKKFVQSLGGGGSKAEAPAAATTRLA